MLLSNLLFLWFIAYGPSYVWVGISNVLYFYDLIQLRTMFSSILPFVFLIHSFCVSDSSQVCFLQPFLILNKMLFKKIMNVDYACIFNFLGIYRLTLYMYSIIAWASSYCHIITVCFFFYCHYIHLFILNKTVSYNFLS